MGHPRFTMMMEQKPCFNDLHLESYHCLVKVIIMSIRVFFVNLWWMDGTMFWSSAMCLTRGNLNSHVALCFENLIFLLNIPNSMEVYGLLQFIAISLHFSFICHGNWNVCFFLSWCKL